jgi:hypothetical protein
MNQEEIDVARNTLIANLFVVGGVSLLFIGALLAANLAYQEYQKSFTVTSKQVEAPPTL